ncbi:MAG: lytic transglycosylase domain-containing protein [Epsilonproteobacteria bacterium]|nr:MAG: lytic transglycosylase domain-containing protein [Campylobacterota bacterium]
MIKYLLVFGLLFTSLNANKIITQEWLNTKPRSIAKDFYLWRYLNQDITPDQAIIALGQARNVNNKLLRRYANKLNHDETSAEIKCMSTNANILLDKDASCIELGMSTYKATKLNENDFNNIIEKVKDSYPQTAKRFEILNATIPFTALVSSSPKSFFDVFNQCGGVYRAKYFNHHLPKSIVKKLIDKKKFAQTIKLIVTIPKLNKLQESLFNINTKGFSHKSTFHLAINAIRHGKEELALQLLETSYKNAYFQQDKDKVLFWQHKLTNSEEYLTLLSNSWDNNIYSMLAFEKTNKIPNNVIYNIENNQTRLSTYNFNNPFIWFPILKDTKKMNKIKMIKYNKLLNSPESLGHLAFVKERFSRYKKSYYITPYKNIIGDLKENRQSLIYAIARQESRFIQTSISSAYAMGVMQIMPFLSKAIAIELKESYDIDKQFEPKTNIRYASHHLDFLEKRLTHPLFISYAYNGGIGFMRRMFKLGLFKKGKYEPYLSMEMLPYDETKKYGKKVLANYYIYQNYLNKDNKISLSTLFQKAFQPYQK